ncbi:MAG: cysteine desulfurase [Epulopiscium sp.]|nr:cysteine desulfurase [Candidatus Epulonipiscium sp.]
MKEIYLDNGATTPPSSEVIQSILQVVKKDYGNPSSLHRKGMQAEEYIKQTSEEIAKWLKVTPKEVYYTSGGTESNNLAILGVANAYVRSGKHLITTQIEHPSVLEPFKKLEEQGYEVTYLPVNQQGYIDLETLKQAIRPDTILVSIMHINNEVGTIQPIDKIGSIIKKINPSTLFHVDAVQSFGKSIIYPKRWNIDLLSISGHKIHGPKGIGVLYIAKDIKIEPLVYGGGQQNGLRSGTENMIGIAGLYPAVKNAYENLKDHVSHMVQLKKYLVNELKAKVENISIHGPKLEEGAPHIINLGFKDIRGEVLLHALEDKKIYVSTGSACSSHKSTKSSTLQALGLSDEEILSSIRISFSPYTTREDIEICIAEMQQIIPLLRKFVPGGKK